MENNTKLTTTFKTVLFCLWLLLVVMFIVVPQSQDANYILFSSILLSILFGLTSFFLTMALSVLFKFK